MATGQNIADKAEEILQDTGNARWTEAEILGWINAGQKEIIVFKPNANPVTAAVQTVAGSKQALPTGGVQFGRCTRNMGANGTTPGATITPLDMDVLDSLYPDWHNATASATSKHSLFDPRFPKIYYLYPPQPAQSPGYVELCYYALPTPLGSLAASIFDDAFETALVDYVLYRLFSRDAAGADLQRADSHFRAFMNALGVKSANEERYSRKQE